MPSILTGLAINTATAGDRTTARGMRLALAALFKATAPSTPTTGVIYQPGSPLTVTTSGSAMEYSVSPGWAAIFRTGQGVYIVGTDAAVVVPTSVGDAANPRIDRIYIFQPDPELGDTGVARIDVVQGTPAASPALPSLPTGALELGRKLVPAGAANTGTGTAISNPAPQTTLGVDFNLLSNLPATFPPSAHTHDDRYFTETEVNNLLAGKAASSHTHDDRYFTETEVNNLLAGKAASSHTHVVANITDLATNGDVAKVGGKRFTVSAGVAPTSPAAGDVWIDY